MTQTQINCFIAVANEGSVTRAANRLYVSQPAISKSISSLERELGFALFHRRDSSLVLTHPGEELYRFFTRTMDEYHSILRSIERDRGPGGTVIRVACPSTWDPDAFYVPIMEHFAQHYPNMRLSVECFPIGEIVMAVKNGQVDVALTLGLSNLERINLRSRVITTTRCGVVFSQKHFPNVTCVQDLRNAAILVYGSDYQNRFEVMLREVCGEEFTPKFKNCSTPDMASFELARGEGIMFFTDWDSGNRSDRYARLPLRAIIPVGAVFPESGGNPQVQLFLDRVTEVFAAVP